MPDVDLFVRSLGRAAHVSNFLLWQSAYAEMVFLDTLWPDFDRRAPVGGRASSTPRRDRRYGGTRSAWDYGPLGVELKENIQRQWWQTVRAAAATTSSAWTPRSSCPRRCGRPPATSTSFTDPLVECLHCHKRFRADHLDRGLRGEARAARPRTASPTIAVPELRHEGAVDRAARRSPAC